nr:MAG TPA: minor tail protein [Caudoviricetes sp.]
MADEVVYYAFEGDSSRLQKATQSAIDSLTLYESTVKNIEGTLSSLTTSLNDTIDWIRLMSSEIKSMTKMASTASDAFKNVRSSSTQYAKALQSATAAQQKNTEAVDSNNKEIKQSGNTATQAKNGYKLLFVTIGELSKGFNSLKSQTKESSNSFKELSAATTTVTSAVRTLVGIDIASIFEKSAMSAMDYIENLNLFNVAMGSSVSQGKKFVSQMQEVYGLDPSNIMTYVGNFNQLASAVEMPAKTATVLSTNMTKMATDVASVFNMDVVDVIDNMKSGMMGMSRAVTKYGMDIRTTTLQQTALSLGIQGNVRDMSEANREGLRYITMVRQASNLSGDWAKTIESPSNQLRILKEQLTQLARSIGNLFLPSIAKVLPYINGFVMALREAITAIAEFFGFTTMDFGGTTSTIDKSTGAIESMGTQADKTAKKLQALKAPFDELNVIQPPTEDDSSSSGSGGSSEMMDPAIAKAIEALNVPLENVRMKANQVRDSLLTFFNLKGESFQNLLKKVKTLFTAIQSVVATLGKKIKEAFQFNNNGVNILNTIKGIFSDIYNWLLRIIQDTQEWANNLDLTPIVSSFSNLLAAIRNLASVIGDQLEAAYVNVLLPLAKWTIEDALPTVINAIANALNWFAEHPDVGAVILGIAGAISFLSTTLSVISTVVETVSSVMSVLNTVMAVTDLSLGALLGWILLIIAAVAAVIAVIILVVTHLDEIRAWFDDVKSKFTTFITNVKDQLDKVKKKLTDFFQPFIDTIQKAKDKFDDIKETISYNIKIITDKFNEIKETLKKVFTALWNHFKKTIIDPVANWFNQHIVQPITKFYVTYLKPVVDKIKKAFGDAFTWIYDKISKIFDKIVKYIVNVFVGAINNVISFFESLVNSVVKAVNLLVKAANAVLPGDEAIDYVKEVSLKRVSYMATGGVVTRPTQAVIGEGKYNEAVIPLGNSPQMEEMLDRFADKVNGQTTDVNVYIGGKKWDAEVYKSSQRGEKEVGSTPLGGAVKI